jgi:hypothetical protein
VPWRRTAVGNPAVLVENQSNDHEPSQRSTIHDMPPAERASVAVKSSGFRKWHARVHYVWVRFGVFALIAMPIAAWLTFRAQGITGETWQPTPAVSFEAGQESFTFTALQPSAAARRLLVIPGCPVESDAYAPLARRLALRGLSTTVVTVPYRCAPLPPQQVTLRRRVAAVLQRCPECEWTIVGHSRGAAHALDLVAAMPDRIAGLVLLGSTHPREKDFSRLPMPVMKVVATNDGVAPLAASEANRRLLPASVRWEVIKGGNHSQFAYYGFQLFDGRASIARAEQHARVVEAVVSFVEARR